MRAWANPKVPLPMEGQQPPMPEEWVVAQSAMRYAGMMKDKPTWPVLIGALKKRPEKIDATMDSLMAGGIAILGMSLRAVGVGASHGLAEWGDNKGFKPLLPGFRHIPEPDCYRHVFGPGLSDEEVERARRVLTAEFVRAGPDESRIIGARTIVPFNGGGDWTCVRPNHWVFAGTGMQAGESIPD